MKPSTNIAMQTLIGQIRHQIPFGLPEAYVCNGKCSGCSMKLLDYLDMQLIDWEHRLKLGDTPNFDDLTRLARTGHKIYRVLDSNGLVGL